MNSDILPFCELLSSQGANLVRVIKPSDLITAPWVVMKCKYGCPNYGHNRSCPPFAPDYKQTSDILRCYSRAIVARFPEMSMGTPAVLECQRALSNAGFYKVLAFGTGPCHKCSACTVDKCPAPASVLPSMEACGIDVVGSVRALGVPMDIPPRPDAPLSCFALLLVD